MNHKYKLLVVGNIYDNHIVRYLTNLKTHNPDITLDVISVKENTAYNDNLNNYVNHLFWFEPHTTSVRFIRGVQRVCQYRRFLNSIIADHHYDIVNIHFPKVEYWFSYKVFRCLGNRILLTPWGSDVYRVGAIGLGILKKLYRKADYVCCTGNRFGNDIRRIFNLPEDRLVNLDIGSDTIDYISENKEKITKLIAQKALKLEGDYFITCGYNAHREQRHLQIIEAIANIKTCLPKDTVLLFPVTYPKDEQYISELKQAVDKHGLRAYFFTNYLSLEDLFALRQSSDMFVHIQTTDANAASIQEYILLGKNVLNGSWLRYGELEQDGNIPYHIIDSIDTLSDDILKAYNSGPIKIQSATIEYIKSYGWKKWIVKWNDFFESIAK